MADLSLRYLLYGEDRTASKSIKGVGAQASSTASLVSGGLGKIGSMLGGEVGDMLNRVSAGFDTIGGKATGMGAKLAVGGTAMMGLGLAMQAMASKDIESMKQLNAAVEATGKGYDGFAGDVDKLIAKQVAFGHTDDEVTTALRVLTQAYGDPKKALAEMSVTTDLAAAKHIDLAAAAGMVAKAHGGAGRVFKEFGITVGTTAAGTKDYDGALTVLSGKLAGQASASMASFGGKVTQVKSWLENQASALSEKYGPAVTVAGGAVTALGSVMQVMAARSAAAALATQAETVAVKGSTVAMNGAASASKAMSLAAGPVGLALVMLTTVAGFFIKGQMDAKQRADDLRGSLDQTTGAITDQTRSLVALQLQQDGTFKLARNLGVSVKTVTDAALGNAGAMNTLRTAQAAQNTVVTTTIANTGNLNDKMALTLGTQNAFATSSQKTVTGAKNQSAGFGALLAAVTPINDVLKVQTTDQEELGTATAHTVDPVKTLAQTQKELADKTKAASDAISSYNQALQDAGLKVLSTRDASRNLKQAVADVDEAVKKNGRTLSENTQKGRDNAAALDAQAGKALSLSKSIGEETGSEAKMRASLLASRTSLVASGIKFGMTKAEAGKYADSVLRIPAKAKTDILLAGAAAAKKQVDDLNRSIAMQHNFPINLNFRVGTGATLLNTANVMNKLLGMQGRAVGGPVLAGIPYVVGDGGRPELFVPDTNGTILPRVPTSGAGPGSAALMTTAMGAGGADVVAAIKDLEATLRNEVARHSRTIVTAQRQMA